MSFVIVDDAIINVASLALVNVGEIAVEMVDIAVAVFLADVVFSVVAVVLLVVVVLVVDVVVVVVRSNCLLGRSKKADDVFLATDSSSVGRSIAQNLVPFWQ